MKRLVILCFLLTGIFCAYPRESEHLKHEELVRLSSSKLIEKGNDFLKKNQEDTALMFFLVLSAKHNEQMDKTEQYLCALSCSKSGDIYYQKGNYSKAFDAFLKGLAICEKHNFKELLPEFYKNMGNVYCIFQDFDRGKINYEKGLAFSVQQGHVETQIKILSNLVGMYCYDGDMEKANYYYRQINKCSEGNNDVLIQYFKNLERGIIYFYEHKYDSAMRCYKASAQYAAHFESEPQYVTASYFELAKLFQEVGETDSALYYLDRNIKIAKDNNLMEMLAGTLKSVAGIYKKKGDKEKERLYGKQHSVIADSVFNLRELSRMKNAQFIYEMEQTKEQIDSLNAEKAQKELKIKAQQRVLFYISAGLLVFIVMLTIVYSQKRKLRLAYKDLYKRNSEILKSEEQSRKSQIEYEKKQTKDREQIKELTVQLQQLTALSQREEVEQALAEPADCAEQKDEAKGHYSVDKLTGVQKEAILRDIQRVMGDSEEFCDCDFSIERLATLVNSNSRYVSQIINDTYGKNFRAYICDYRIKEAQLRLMNTAVYGNYTIKAIAESVGYKSHTNFIIIFRKMTGMTPSMYQKMALEDKIMAI